MFAAWMAGAAALAQTTTTTNTAPATAGYHSPNSVVGIGLGTPSLLSIRGEAWVADDASFELGLGLPADFDLQGLGGDWAIRWRPDLVCINCEGVASATFGIGLGGLVGPNFDGGPWGFAVGGDLVGTGVWWFTPDTGLQLSARFGLGPGWTGADLSATQTAVWAFVSAGLAF